MTNFAFQRACAASVAVCGVIISAFLSRFLMHRARGRSSFMLKITILGVDWYKFAMVERDFARISGSIFSFLSEFLCGQKTKKASGEQGERCNINCWLSF